jgi:hypothetical protein
LYVLDRDASWVITAPLTETALGRGVALTEQGEAMVAQLPKLLAELDNALLSTVAADTVIEDLAGALDTALDHSLWQRQLSRADEGDRELFRSVIVGRARWLWSRTDSASRLGYFQAGVGFDTGTFIEAHLAELHGQLLVAEGALITGRHSEAAEAVVSIADTLRTVDPFQFEDAPLNWKPPLRRWITGGPVRIATEGDESPVAFLQNDVVFRLVWALEAIRSLAVAKSLQDSDLIEGRVALALTFGLPTPDAVRLAQHGVRSREMIMEMLAAVPMNNAALSDWIAAADAEVRAKPVFSDPESMPLWEEFVQRNRAGGRNYQDLPRHRLAWRPASEDGVPAGTPVTLVDDASVGITFVCGTSLQTLGELVQRFPIDPGIAVRCSVGELGNEIVVDVLTLRE